MKIGLIQPNQDEEGNKKQAYGSNNRPPETGLAVLASWVGSYSQRDHHIKIFDPNRDADDIAREASEYDLFGMTNLFSNYNNCMNFARAIKSYNNDTKIVFGGPNASMIPRRILKNNPSIDYVVRREGENSLLMIADGKPLDKIPNLWYRDEERLKYTFNETIPLKEMPLWDFSNHENAALRLEEYLDAQKNGFDPWLVPPLTLFSFRGCMKAIREDVCSYCTSSEKKGRALPSDKLWLQARHLIEKYGAKTFYISDDIFPIASERVRKLAKAKPNDIRPKIRAYGYLPYLAELNQKDLEGMAKNLEEIGVFNLFFGSENYDPKILAGINKKGVTVDETSRVIRTLFEYGGVKTTLAYLLGLPGETKESLEINKDSLRKLMGLDNDVERLYISIGMPLVGTGWFNMLEANINVVTDYLRETGKILSTEDFPDYDLLAKLSAKHTSSVTPQEINFALEEMVMIAGEKIPPHRIGGFKLAIDKVKG